MKKILSIITYWLCFSIHTYAANNDNLYNRSDQKQQELAQYSITNYSTISHMNAELNQGTDFHQSFVNNTVAAKYISQECNRLEHLLDYKFPKNVRDLFIELTNHGSTKHKAIQRYRIIGTSYLLEYCRSNECKGWLSTINEKDRFYTFLKTINNHPIIRISLRINDKVILDQQSITTIIIGAIFCSNNDKTIAKTQTTEFIQKLQDYITHYIRLNNLKFEEKNKLIQDLIFILANNFYIDSEQTSNDTDTLCKIIKDKGDDITFKPTLYNGPKHICTVSVDGYSSYWVSASKIVSQSLAEQRLIQKLIHLKPGIRDALADKRRNITDSNERIDFVTDYCKQLEFLIQGNYISKPNYSYGEYKKDNTISIAEVFYDDQHKYNAYAFAIDDNSSDKATLDKTAIDNATTLLQDMYQTNVANTINRDTPNSITKPNHILKICDAIPNIDNEHRRILTDDQKRVDIIKVSLQLYQKTPQAKEITHFYADHLNGMQNRISEDLLNNLINIGYITEEEKDQATNYVHALETATNPSVIQSPNFVLKWGIPQYYISTNGDKPHWTVKIDNPKVQSLSNGKKNVSLKSNGED